MFRIRSFRATVRGWATILGMLKLSYKRKNELFAECHLLDQAGDTRGLPVDEDNKLKEYSIG